MATSNTIDVTTDDFREDFPEFDENTFTDEEIQRCITRAYCYCSQKNGSILKGDCRKTAIELMTAHLLTIWKRTQDEGITSNYGITSSSKIGEISVSMYQPTTNSLFQYWISSTAYGMEYYALLMAKCPTPLLFGGSSERVYWTK